MRSALWAAGLGALAGGTLTLLGSLYQAFARGQSLGPVLADLPAVGGSAAVFMLPVCFINGLLVAALLHDLRNRGVRRIPLAITALAAGSLFTLLFPVAVLWALLGPRAIMEIVTLESADAVSIVAFTVACGLGTGAGALFGMKKEAA